MAKTSNVIQSFNVSGDGIVATSGWSNTTTNGSSPDGGLHQLALALGDNTISVPAGTNFILIIPPSGSTIVKKLKGVAGDTGWVLAKTLPTTISVTVGSTYIINAAAAETVYVAFL